MIVHLGFRFLTSKYTCLRLTSTLPAAQAHEICAVHVLASDIDSYFFSFFSHSFSLGIPVLATEIRTVSDFAVEHCDFDWQIFHVLGGAEGRWGGWATRVNVLVSAGVEQSNFEWNGRKRGLYPCCRTSGQIDPCLPRADQKRVDLQWMMWWWMMHISERAATTE